jgi:Uma2 family endonuclease
MMSTEIQLMTADELLALPKGEFRYELVNGELKKMSPAGHEHGRVTIRLTLPLALHVQKHGLGEVYAAETGFKLSSNPDTVRAPDIAFIRQEHVDAVGKTKGFWPGAPDLAVEVLSPSDTVGEIEEKVTEWLTAGVAQVWVVSPNFRTVTVYRSADTISVLTENDLLDGEDVLPGFQIQVREIFA